MSLGAFPTLDACITGLADRYPDPAVRAKVCGSLQRRLEAKPLHEAGEAVERHEADTATTRARVEDSPGYWIVRDVVATRVGVSIGQRVLKRAEAVRQTADLLEGAPLVYGFEAHYHPDGLEPDPLAAPGFAVNARVEGDAAVYDALLWRANPAGHRVPAGDLEKNQAFADAVRRGEAVHNSVGSLGVERMESGRHAPMGGGDPVPYEAEQVRVLKVGHVAILSPVATGRGSCPAPACGARPSAPALLAEALKVPVDAVLLAAGIAARRL